MKLTLAWLKDHLATDASLAEIADRLTKLGLEVETVVDRAAALADLRVGYVASAEPHPNADRLRLCRVDDGGGIHQVVCGAPNARPGMKGAFAPPGSYIPATGMILKPARIRGVDSNGMLCSERELGLSESHAGIIELPDDAEIGAPVAQVLGLDDPLIEIGLTPNRADCAGVRGIARDLAAAGLGSLKPLDLADHPGSFASPLRWRRDFADGAGDACPMVVGRLFRGVANGPSPKWLQNRLRAIGLRPISALVDITNYLTFDLARPLHVFDADTLVGDPTMRFARPGEQLAALDGKTHRLTPDMVVIADDRGVQAVGGVIGGAGSGCGPDTTNVFLEVALFDPLRIAAAGRCLGIVSDARYRFERGVDPTSTLWGVQAATRLILALCGGAASELVTAGAAPDWRRAVRLRKSRVMALGGLQLPDGEAARILAALGFALSDEGEVLGAEVPPWRPDIGGEADLVEEVLRVHGYDSIPAVPMPRARPTARPVLTPSMARAGQARRALAARGLVETVNYSFIPRALAEQFGGAPRSLCIDNPISAELDQMRPSLLPGLVEAARRNADRGYPDGALFEVGPLYLDDTPDGQLSVAAGLYTGLASPRHWAVRPRPADAFDAKGDALAALGAIGAALDAIEATREAPGWYHPGRSGALKLGTATLAQFGELNPGLADTLGLRAPVAAFEVFLDLLPPPKRARGAARPALDLAAFQPVTRDFAFIVDDSVAAAQVVRAARGAESALVAQIRLFDVYRGAELGAGRKSVAIEVTLAPREHTLTDAEIEAVANRIVGAVTKATGGTLRG